MEPARRCLIAMPAGRDSTHFRWLPGSPQRSWRLVVNWYDKDVPPDGVCDELFHAPGTYKFPGLKPVLEERIDSADLFWLPDDDLELDPRDIDRLFAAFARSGLDVAQPALTGDSATAWGFLKKHTNAEFRRTSFVECMCPLFTRRALELLLPHLSSSQSGWGLDILWSTLALRAGYQVGVIECIQVRHTRPVGVSPLYHRLAAEGISPGDEMGKLIREFRLPGPDTIWVESDPSRNQTWECASSREGNGS